VEMEKRAIRARGERGDASPEGLLPAPRTWEGEGKCVLRAVSHKGTEKKRGKVEKSKRSAPGSGKTIDGQGPVKGRAKGPRDGIDLDVVYS